MRKLPRAMAALGVRRFRQLATTCHLVIIAMGSPASFSLMHELAGAFAHADTRIHVAGPALPIAQTRARSEADAERQNQRKAN